MKIVIGSDHAGFHLKKELLGFLREAGHAVHDIGSHTPDEVDFPDIARNLCSEVVTGRAERGVMICGTGVGAAIAANKIDGVRAAVCHDVHSAHQAVEHDDVNVICLGAQIVGPWLARDLLATYLAAKFEATEDLRRRLGKLAALEKDTTPASPGSL